MDAISNNIFVRMLQSRLVLRRESDNQFRSAYMYYRKNLKNRILTLWKSLFRDGNDH